MHASMFSLVLKGTNQLICPCKRLLNYWEKMRISGWELGWLLRGFTQFLGKAADCYPYLRKFWVENPSWEGLWNFLGEAFSAELCNFWSQQVASQDCIISRGKAGCPLDLCKFLKELFSLLLDQVWMNILWGECIKVWSTCFLFARKSLELVYLMKQDKVLWKVGREAPKWS